MENTIKVALADDHILLRNALASLIDSFGGFKVIHQSGTGKEVIRALAMGVLPDVVILDLNMPELDGFETAEWIRQNFPEIQILMLTMYDSELSLVRLYRLELKDF